MIKNIVLINADKNDKELIREIHHQAYKEMVIAQFGKWNIDFQNNMFEDDWKKGGFELISFNSYNCGYILTNIDDNTLSIIDFAILSKYQNSKIGSNVLNIIKKRATDNKQAIKLGAFITNVNAHRFYKNNGFVESNRSNLHILYEWKSDYV